MAFLTIVIETESNSVPQLNQLQVDSTKIKEEWNQLIDYLGRCSGGNEVVTSLYIVTNNADPNVSTDGGSSEKIEYNV